jgi:DNA primase
MRGTNIISWAQQIARARDVRVEQVIEQRAIRLRGKVDRCGSCPACGGRDRFSINIRKQVFNCRGCGQGGDVISLVQFLDGSDFPNAVATLAGGEPVKPRREPRQPNIRTKQDSEVEDYEREQRDKARRLYRASRPATGTVVEAYLRSRGITLAPSTLRFLPPFKSERHPAMLVPYGLPQEHEPGIIEIPVEAITAVQLTLLKPNGSGKADIKKPGSNKLTIGSPAGMPMVLAPMNDLLGLAITEGVEDALSVHQATGLGAWASGGWPFMPKLIAAIERVIPDCVTICADADLAGQRGALELADQIDRLGIEVLICGLVS